MRFTGARLTGGRGYLAALLGTLLVAPLVAVSATTPAAGEAPADLALWTWGSNETGQMLSPLTRYRTDPLPILAGVTDFSSGDSLGAAVVDGEVWVWGGSLNYGATASHKNVSTPRRVPGLSGIRRVSVGSTHILAVDAAGDIWAWGGNGTGQLGIGSAGADEDLPQRLRGQTPGLPDFVDVEAGDGISVGIDAGGDVWRWGRQLAGVGPHTLTPVLIPGLTQVREVSIGIQHLVALTGSGQVMAWGSNYYGQLGQGDQSARAGAVTVPGLTDVLDVAVGTEHSLALRADGSVVTWGANFDRVIAGGPSLLLTPTPIPGLPAMSAVGAAEWGSLAVSQTGALWTWGAGQTSSPAAVPGPTSFVATDGANGITFVLDASGVLHSFGDATSGTLGDTYGQTLEPVRLAPPLGTVSISAGQGHVLALTAAGEVFGWGNNDTSQVSSGQAVVASPEQIPFASPITRVQAGYRHSLAVDEAGSLWAWGRNISGQLGDGTAVTRSTPTLVPLPAPVVDLDAGAPSTIVADDQGQVWTWGGNDSGELGTGDEQPRYAPVQVSFPSPVTDIAMGEEHAVALDETGTVWTWGWNSDGQLGLGARNAPNRTSSPQPVPGLPPMVAVEAGSAQTFALEADGTVWEWGQVLPDREGSWTPRVVAGLPAISQISGSGDVRLGKSLNGEVWAWGDNTGGDLATGNTEPVNVPRRVGGLSAVNSVHVSKNYRETTLFVLAAPSRTTSVNVAPGGAVTSGLAVSDLDPVNLSLTSPLGGTVSISEDPRLTIPGAFEVLGVPFGVSAPTASVAEPLRLTLTVHRSVIPDGTAISSITPLRNGQPVPNCAAGAGTSATPDPCVSSRARDALGTVRLEVRSSAASTWAMVVYDGPPALPPLVSVDGLAEGAELLLGASVPVSVTCQERGLAVTSCVAPTHADTSAVGGHTLVAQAIDETGAVTRHEVGYHVRYRFSGFEGPVVASPAVNVGKAGRTYPLRWSLLDAAGVRLRSRAAVESVRVIPADCADFGRAVGPAQDADGPGGNGFSLDAKGWFSFNWKTPKSAGCYRMEVVLADGTAPWLAMSLR